MTTLSTALSPKTKRPVNFRMIFTIGAVAAIPLVIIGAVLYSFLEPPVKDLGNGVKVVQLKAMSNFPFPQENGTINDVPKQWRELDGQKVVLYGEIWNDRSAGDGKLDSFELCYSIAKCCFQGTPQIQHFVKARVKPQAAAYYRPNLVKVTGVLHVEVVYDKEAGKVSQVYRMDVEDVKAAT